MEKGSRVAVFGLGAVGLAVIMVRFQKTKETDLIDLWSIQGAKHVGASQIVAIDTNPEKFELGL